MAKRTDEGAIEKAEGQELTIGGVSVEAITAIDEASQKYGLDSAYTAAGSFKAGLMMAEGIKVLREMMTPDIMKAVMPLQNTALGFKTDRKGGGYDLGTVRECVIEGSLRGARVVGNELNIIAGGCYLTREFFTRRLREYPELTDLDITAKIDALSKGDGESKQRKAIVSFKASWRLNALAQKLEGEIPVIVYEINGAVSPDAILGKADRKIKARIFAKISGSTVTLPDGEVDDAITLEKPPASAEPASDPLAEGRTATRKKPVPTPEPEASPAPEAVDTETGEIVDAEFTRIEPEPEQAPGLEKYRYVNWKGTEYDVRTYEADKIKSQLAGVEASMKKMAPAGENDPVAWTPEYLKVDEQRLFLMVLDEHKGKDAKLNAK